MRIYILLDSDGNITSYFYDPYEGAIEIELESGFDISKLPYCKYENGQITYVPERETLLKQYETDYKTNYVSEPTAQERIEALEAALLEVVLGG